MPSDTSQNPDENDFVHWPEAPGTSLTGLDKSMILASVEELAPSLAPGGPLPAATSFSDQEEGSAAAAGKFYPASRAWFRTTEPLAPDREKKERWWQDEATPEAAQPEKTPPSAPLPEAEADNEAALSPEEIWELAAEELSRVAALPEGGAPAAAPPAGEKKPKVVLPEKRRPMPSAAASSRHQPGQGSHGAEGPFFTANPLADHGSAGVEKPASAIQDAAALQAAAPSGMLPGAASPFLAAPEEPAPEAEKIAPPRRRADSEAGELEILPADAAPAAETSRPPAESPSPFFAASPFSLEPPAEEPKRPLLPAQRMFQQAKVVQPGEPATPSLEEVHGDDIVFPPAEWQHSGAPHVRRRLRPAGQEIQAAEPEKARRSKAGLFAWLLLALLAAASAAVIWREKLPEPWRGRVTHAWETVFFSFEQFQARPVPPASPSAVPSAPASETPALVPPSTPDPASQTEPSAGVPQAEQGESEPAAPAADEAAPENTAVLPTAPEPQAEPEPPAENGASEPAPSPEAPSDGPASPPAEAAVPMEASGTPPLFTGVVVPQTGAAASAVDPAFSGEVPLAEAAELAQAKQTVTALISASTVEEVLPHVFDAAALEPKMRGYYAQHPLKPLAGAVIELEYSGVVPSNGLRAYIFNVLHPSRPRGFPVAAEFSEDRYRIDWESHIQWRDEWLRSFLTAKENTPQNLMVVLHRTHYFNDDVPLLDEKLAFKVTSAIPGDEGAVVFVDKQSALGRSLASEYEWRVSYFPLAELQWVSEGESRYIRLNRIVRANWRRNAR